ncbi:MAG: flagellar type III secretion system pore protein FliP [Acidobacteria bacterium]|nr:flagellar type III secretion system pore protein FliP [Acidobacteriota bacterium]
MLQPTTTPQPLIGINIGGENAVANSVQLFLLVTVLSLLPSIIVMATSFTRLVIVFHFVRQAMGTQSVPSNQILVGLALILTFFVMGPTLQEIKIKAYDPMVAGQIGLNDALSRAADPLKTFMLKYTREKDLALFIHLSKGPKPKTRAEVPLSALAPAFVISEIKTAFEIGFLIFLPFLIVDLVVASILLAMGMMMLPPVLISLPFKILLFVMVDGWHLLVLSLMQGYTGAGV